MKELDNRKCTFTRISKKKTKTIGNILAGGQEGQ